MPRLLLLFLQLRALTLRALTLRALDRLSERLLEPRLHFGRQTLGRRREHARRGARGDAVQREQQLLALAHERAVEDDLALGRRAGAPRRAAEAKLEKVGGLGAAPCAVQSRERGDGLAVERGEHLPAVLLVAVVDVAAREYAEQHDGLARGVGAEAALAAPDLARVRVMHERGHAARRGGGVLDERRGERRE